MFADLREAFEEHPVAVATELGSLLVCCLLVLGTVLAVATGPPTGEGVGGAESVSTADALAADWVWLGVVALGAAFVLFWTAFVPLYERRLDDE